MEKELVETIHIDAAPEKVWQTLTDPDKIQQYMFGSRAKTNWKPGTVVDFYLQQDNRERHVVTGKVLKAEPPRLLEHTLFPVGADFADIPENHLIAVYKIEPEENGSRLTIIQRDFSTVAQGKRRYDESVEGWKSVLPKLKEVAEG